MEEIFWQEKLLKKLGFKLIIDMKEYLGVEAADWISIGWCGASGGKHFGGKKCKMEAVLKVGGSLAEDPTDTNAVMPRVKCSS